MISCTKISTLCVGPFCTMLATMWDAWARRPIQTIHFLLTSIVLTLLATGRLVPEVTDGQTHSRIHSHCQTLSWCCFSSPGWIGDLCTFRLLTARAWVWICSRPFPACHSRSLPPCLSAYTVLSNEGKRPHVLKPPPPYHLLNLLSHVKWHHFFKYRILSSYLFVVVHLLISSVTKYSGSCKTESKICRNVGAGRWKCRFLEMLETGIARTERQKEMMHAGTHIQTTISMKGHSSSTLMAHGYSGPERHM